MKKVIDELEKIILQAGLSREDVVKYWQQQETKQQLGVENVTLSGGIVNSKFPECDIRSRTELFWYAFAGGKFAPNYDAYPDCQGVVGWINSDLNAPKGDRIYIVLPN